jgi:hypothetical protein
MKNYLLLFCLFSIALVSCNNKVIDNKQKAIDNNQNYNLNFEDINLDTHLPTGWGVDNIENDKIPADSTLCAFSIDTQVKQNGKYSLLIDWKVNYGEWTASNYVIRETFEGKRIRLTGFLKTENITEGAGMWMRIDGKVRQKGRPLAFDNMGNRLVKGTTDWREYTIELDYDAEHAGQITVGGILMGSGKMWMDKLHISIDGKDIRTAPLKTDMQQNNAEADTQFATASGIAAIQTDSTTVKNLVNLGMLWGFVKYYHAVVATGDVNMDAELCRVLPKVLSATNSVSANEAMEKWVDGLGKPEPCKNCTPFKKTESIKLAPDYGYLFEENNLPKTLRDKLEYIKLNRRPYNRHYYIDAEEGVENPIFKNENDYNSAKYPDAGIRLLALYRYWNMIQYFFPDRHLIGEDWSKVLGEFIPVFCNAKDTLAYQLACLKIIARIHDTHANVWRGDNEINKMKGKYITPFQAKFIEDKLVVTGYYKDVAGIKDLVKPGDVIEKINFIAVGDLVNKYLPLTPASNYETQQRILPGADGWLLRTNSPTMQLLINRNGKQSGLAVQTVAIEPAMRMKDWGADRENSYSMLPDNIGYIYPGKLKTEDFEKIQNAFAGTKGIVIDMRCYPSDFMAFTYGKWLKPKSTPFVKFTHIRVSMPGVIEYGIESSNGGGWGNHYNGRVVIIVNAVTQSTAEYQTMALSSALNVTVIGSTTAGADGNVSKIVLPGGISTMISGIGILYPDGTETQRKGVRINKVIRPTIKGIQAGRDELMEEAIKIIKG